MNRFTATLILAVVCISVYAGRPLTVNLYSAVSPAHAGAFGDTARITVYLPEAKQATGRAVLICPGGAYGTLASGHEGHDWAPFFTGQGIAAIVLKYRLPHGDVRVPVEDAEAAMRLIRGNARRWGIDPKDIGIMGSSAGGHLAATIATQARGDATPAFQILFYPVITMDPAYTHPGSHDNLLGHKPRKSLERQYSADIQVSRLTPRAFIALSDDDDLVLPANGANYYNALYRHDIPATLHIFPTGGHGWGFSYTFPYHIEMLLMLKAWLKSF